MDQKKFLASVVSWDTGGYVNITWQRLGRWSSRFCQTVDDALRLANELATGPNNVFFCLSTQSITHGFRKGIYALMLGAVWVDMDVKPDKPETHYVSVEEAIVDLLLFCKRVKIPYPSIIVLTGGGIHAYWLSHRPLTVDEWKPFANGLKAAALREGLKLDAACTADVVRVLRIPGTFNQKYNPPKEVTFFQDYCGGERHDFAAIFDELVGLAPPDQGKAPTSKIEVASAFKHLAVGGLGQGIELDKRPLPLQPILEGCAWLREAIDTGGEKFDNNQWNLTNLAAIFLEDGHDLIHSFGNKHPTYDSKKTDEQWERKNRERRDSSLGWPTCRAIQDAGSAHCKSCKHFLTGGSPLHLGFAALPPLPKSNGADSKPASDEEISFLGGTRPPELRLPEGFALNEKRQVCFAIVSKEKGGKTVEPGRLMPLFNGEFSDPSFRAHNGVMGIAFTAKVDRESAINVFLSVSDCCKRENLFKALGAKNIGHIVDAEVEAMGAKFMSSWLEKLQEEDVAIHEQGSIGWHYDKDGTRIGFAYGGKLYRTTGEIVVLRSNSDDAFHSYYAPKGSREIWLKSAKLLTDRKIPQLDIIISIAFAAPLTVFAGTLYGAVLSIFGPPGTSKSTGQQVAASTWGHPKQTRESLTSTPKSIQGRLGRTRNLPAYWDDIQDERHQQALFDTMFVASEGAEGGRLNPDASYKQRLEWQTLLAACSNASFVEFLIKKQKSTTAGMRRVFEIEFPKPTNDVGMIDAVDASKTFAELEHHYGMIGAEYARLLATKHNEIDVLVSDTIRDFSKRVGGLGDESYWWGMCGTLLVGAALANKLGAEIDVAAMEKTLVKAFEYNRDIRAREGTEGGTTDNTEYTLTAFLNHYSGSGNIIFTDRTFRNRHLKVEPLRAPGDNRPIYIQVVRDERMVIISKRAMREFMWKNEIQTRQVFKGLESYYNAVEARTTLGAGTAYGQTQEICYEIYVPQGEHRFLEHLLNAYGVAKPVLMVKS